MSAPAITFGARLSPAELDACSTHLKALVQLIGPASSGGDLYALCAQDALSGIGITEEQLNEMRRETARKEG